MLYKARPDFFHSHEMKNSWLSSGFGSVLFAVVLALESRMLASTNWLNFSPLQMGRIFSWWELRLAGGNSAVWAGQDTRAAQFDAAFSGGN